MSDKDLAIYDDNAVIEAAERRAAVLDLRKQGFSIQAIVKILVDKYPLITANMVRYDLKFTLQELRRERLENMALFIDLELARLDAIQVPIWQYIGSENSEEVFPAVSMVLKIMEQRQRLLGLPDTKLAQQYKEAIDAGGNTIEEGLDRIVALLNTARARRNQGLSPTSGPAIVDSTARTTK
jgi:hypothetical protein